MADYWKLSREWEKDVRSEKVVCFVVSMLAFVPVSGLAENWPNWRGPTRDGVSSEVNLPVEWDANRNVAWKLEMPAWFRAGR